MAGYSGKIYCAFEMEACIICSRLIKTNPTSASKYSEIKRYSSGSIGTAASRVSLKNRDKTKALVNKNSANTLFESIEKQLSLIKKYMDEVNQAKVQFVNGQWGYKDSAYVPKEKNYNANIDAYNTFATKLRSQINTSIARINLISNLTILK